MTVVESVVRELEQFGPLAESVLAATALALAAELDDVVAEEACDECGHRQEWTVAHNSATSKSMVAKELRETMSALRELAPPKPEEDEVDRARQRRAERLAGRAATRPASSS